MCSGTWDFVFFLMTNSVIHYLLKEADLYYSKSAVSTCKSIDTVSCET